jgi:hypothetical protein
MNCKHVQELLPLYVGRDLEAQRAPMIAAHVQSCTECARSLAEYSDTRQLLQEFAPPPFDEAVFDGIRQRVLSEIEGEAPATGLSRLLEGLFRPRLGWAMAAALLLAVCVSAFYFITTRPGNLKGPEVAKSGSTIGVPSEAPKPQSPSNTSDRRDPGAERRLAGTPRTFGSKRTKVPAMVVDSNRSIAAHQFDNLPLNAQVLPDDNNGTEPNAVPAVDPVAPERLRLEIQTNDPNIRIIWFSPQPTKTGFSR